MTSGGYGFAVERSIAYAYLPPDRAAIGTRGEVEVFGDWIGFEVAREPLYDPEGRTDPGMTGDDRCRARRGTEPRRGWRSRLACCDEADELAMTHFRRDLVIETKPDRTFVTQADQAIERAIRDADRGGVPGARGRRRGVRHRSDGAGRIRWYIDPIDGTHNFMRGVPLFGTLLRLERDGELSRRSS